MGCFSLSPLLVWDHFVGKLCLLAFVAIFFLLPLLLSSFTGYSGCESLFPVLILESFLAFFLLYGMLWWVVVRDVPYGPRPVLDIWVLNLIWFWYLYRHIFYWSCTVFLTFLFWETAPCLLLACYGCWLIGFGDQLFNWYVFFVPILAATMEFLSFRSVAGWTQG